jgi:membrane protease YdiL (CAAX protease family)
MNRITPFIKHYPLITFFGATISLGWFLTLIMTLLPPNPLLLPLIALPISYVPTAGAWLILRVAGTADERASFRQRLRHWRVGLRWYLVAVLLLPLIHLAGTGLATFLGGQFPLHPAMLAMMVAFLPTNLGEEIGWRGFVLPRLQARADSLTASLILGAMWALFHAVALLQNPTQPLAYLLVGIGYMLAMSSIMTWVFNHTGGSVLLMVLVHAAYDTTAFVVTPLVETTVPLVAFALGMVVAWLVTSMLVLVSGRQLARTPPTWARVQRVPVVGRS